MKNSKFRIGDFVKVKGTPREYSDNRICVISGQIKKISFIPHKNKKQEDLGLVVDIITDEDTKKYFRSVDNAFSPIIMTFREDDLELEIIKNRECKLNDLGI
jgi:hypothetical protein